VRLGIRSIRAKIQLAIALTSAGVVLLLAALLVLTQYSSAKRDLVRNLRTLSQVVADSVAAPLAFDAPDEAKEALQSVRALPGLASVAIERPDGTLFLHQTYAGHRPVVFPRFSPHSADFIWRDDTVLVPAPIVLDGQVRGTLWMASDLAVFRAHIREIISWGIYLYVLAAVLSGLVAWLLQRVITRPILELAHTTARITREGPSSVRARKRADDEIGALVDSLNQMLDHIADQAAKLHDRERCYRTLFSQAANAVFLEDGLHRVLEANQTAEALFKQNQGTLVGRSTTVLFRTPGDFPSPEIGERETVLNAHACQPDGKTVPVEITVTGIEDAGRHLFLTSAVDITDRLRAQHLLEHARDELKRQVEAATAELREANESLHREMDDRRRLERQMMMSEKTKGLGLMAAGIAHDFNNLLQSILGNTDLLQHEEKALSEDGMISVGEIRNAARSAADLASQMLAYAGKSALRIQPLDLNAQLRNMTPLLEAAVPKNARGKLELAEGLPMIDADEGQVRQMVLNLVTNAAEALPASGGTYTIRTGERHCDQEFLRHTILHEDLPSGRYLSISVSDDGCGLEPGAVDRIFDPFFSTKFAGRGLGLASVLGIIRAHRAAITVDSALGEGSTFTVYFPVSRSGGGVIEEHMPIADDWHGSGLAVVADDEEGVRHVARRMFRRIGFDVEVVESGEEALDICRARGGEVALYVLDMSMPGMGGVEAAREILALQPNAKIVLSSAYTRNQIEAEKGNLPIAGFLHKPYERGTLCEHLASILGD
jgi:PAS domain S-box-containing protein